MYRIIMIIIFKLSGSISANCSQLRNHMLGVGRISFQIKPVREKREKHLQPCYFIYTESDIQLHKICVWGGGNTLFASQDNFPDKK